MTDDEGRALEPDTPVWWRRTPATVVRHHNAGITILVEYRDGTKAKRTVTAGELEPRQETVDHG